MAGSRAQTTDPVDAPRPGTAGQWELEAFCRSEHPRLVGALGLYTGDRDLAEELAQEALLRACRDWDRVRTFEAPGAWVHRVGMNLATSVLRRRAVFHRITAAARPTPASYEDPDPAQLVVLRQALAGLPHKMRAILVLRFFADLSVREVAGVLSCPEGTVKTLTSRAVERLRATGLADLEADDAD